MSNSNSGGNKASKGETGVSDEVYDLMVTLTNKLQELWRLDEFIGDEGRSYDRQMWQQIREHDRQDVQALVAELKRELGGGQGGSQGGSQ